MYKVLVVAAFVLLPFTIWAGECQWWPLIGLLAAVDQHRLQVVEVGRDHDTVGQGRELRLSRAGAVEVEQVWHPR